MDKLGTPMKQADPVTGKGPQVILLQKIGELTAFLTIRL